MLSNEKLGLLSNEFVMAFCICVKSHCCLLLWQVTAVTCFHEDQEYVINQVSDL